MIASMKIITAKRTNKMVPKYVHANGGTTFTRRSVDDDKVLDKKKILPRILKAPYLNPRL